ncbi:MAG: hypothetical protein Q8J62_10735 [Candidatus Cloacimonadaceae bacterium]|nr:hypothetical protein [Candidatus Cloacimonadaceae bacterium]
MRYRVIFVVYMCLLMSGLAAEQWKVFNNEELGYSVSYPANFSAQYQDSQFSALLSDGSSMSPVTLTFTSDLLNPEDLGKGIDQTLEQFFSRFAHGSGDVWL